MNVFLIDYSELYYSNVAKTAVPEKRKGKFIQIRNRKTDYLVFSPTEFSPYHTNIVERFCLDRGIAGSCGGERKSFDIHDPDWTIAGGGKFEIDKAKKYVRLYDDSLAYGRFDTEGLKERIGQIDELSGYEVRIE